MADFRGFALAALSAGLVIASCGGDDGNKKALGPDAAGGAGGEAQAGAGGERAAILRCGTASCSPRDVGATLTLPACCPADSSNRCGLDVSAASALLGIEAGCVELGQPGEDDAACPALTRQAGVAGLPDSFAGCCRAGRCGLHV